LSDIEIFYEEEILTLREQIKASQEETSFLREQNKALQEALEIERAHSREIAERLAQIMENQQKLIGIEKMPLIADGESKKRGFFGLFKRK
jgi:septal ring factor EnvC (AmiA/AmiB activator)